MKSTENNTFNNALNCIHYNEQLNILISETMSNIDRNIESLKDSQDYLLSQLKKEDQVRGSYVMQFIYGMNMQIIRSPYFMTPLGLTPFTNRIQKEKICAGFVDHYIIKGSLIKICSQKQLDILKEAIGKNVLDIEMKRLANSSSKTKSREISSLLSLPFEKLSEKCDSFMIDKIDWMGISAQSFRGKISTESCYKIWEQIFNPEFVTLKWTEEECEKLKFSKSKNENENWIKIASEMSVKIQPLLCAKKWLELTNKQESCNEWSQDEDAHLCNIVSSVQIVDQDNQAYTNWNKVASLVSNRSARDCERRWNSLQTIISTRQFTDGEDYQLLLLIKRMGMENWTDIAREMDQRTADQCQLRYCEIVEDLHPWTYLEDRQLWLYLRPHFRELWSGNNRLEDISKDLRLYRSVMKCFNGRCAIVIRHRYFKLCKWFALWNQFYLCLNSRNDESTNQPDCQTTSLLSDICPEKTAILTKIRNIILKTSFFDALRKAIRANGSSNPDRDANELISLCKSGNSTMLNKLIKESTDHNLMEFLLFIADLQNGTFIPRKFEKYIHRPNNMLKNPEKADSDLRCLSSNVRAYGIKTAIVETLKKRLTDLVIDPAISQHDKSCIEKLLGCEGTFVAALNFAVTNLERTHDFNFVIKADILEKVLPRFLKLMAQYIYDQENAELLKSSQVVRFSKIVSDKREQIADLLLYRHLLTEIYKGYPSDKKFQCLISQTIPSSISQTLVKEDRQSGNKVLNKLSMWQQHPKLDKVIYQTSENNMHRTGLVDLMSPNRCSLHFLRAFLLQKQSLIQSGEDEFHRIVHLKYDHPTKILNVAKESSLCETPMEIDQSPSILSDPRFTVLKSRILSLTAIPSIIARISPFSTALTADKLHEDQNGVINSNEISKAFNTVSEIPYNLSSTLCRDEGSSPGKIMPSNRRKRKILECLDAEVINVSENPDSGERRVINENQPLTRRVTQNYLSVFLPDSKRTVLISRDVFHPFIASNFEIDSINGVPVSEIIDE